jgi:hypothetical protein
MENWRPLTVKHHFESGSDSDFSDPDAWNAASYTPDLLVELEPID